MDRGRARESSGRTYQGAGVAAEDEIVQQYRHGQRKTDKGRQRKTRQRKTDRGRQTGEARRGQMDRGRARESGGRTYQ